MAAVTAAVIGGVGLVAGGIQAVQGARDKKKAKKEKEKDKERKRRRE